MSVPEIGSELTRLRRSLERARVALLEVVAFTPVDGSEIARDALDTVTGMLTEVDLAIARQAVRP